MVETVKKIAKLHVDLTTEERVLFSTAWKSYISRYRDAREHIALVQNEESKNENNDKIQLTSETRATVESQINQICNELVSILNNDLLPYSNPGNSRVFLMKMFLISV
jgi:14-3-3 protein epsilon